ncbi:DUF2339 domain-containing protein [Algoriphagus aquimarinus]|uniref:DUF2339 domain-containing protein n=1 Tax=Algoriphagus aquimarinus TaxID=237018 RepID=UPI0030DAF3C9|tara:strand:+ start:31778 stop:34108 length:2331 start_codon:yes stop_codon:yes gene_type:complete
MTDKNEQINILSGKLDLLLRRQTDFSKEIEILREEIRQLNPEAKSTGELHPPLPNQAIAGQTEEKKPTTLRPQENQAKFRPYVPKKQRTKSEIEKYIGENLINKIGIAITIIGVAIGAKYSIDHELISPLTRIILGYLMGIGLLGFGMKLKEKYENFSAVLVSGAMAIMYFITFLAYDLYSLIPQLMTFGLMVVFTAFTVAAAIKYNKQVIAHIGLVGAYAVPFLLSDGSGNVVVLLSYITIINVGILVLSFKKYWKQLYYASFGLTWAIFFIWYLFSYEFAVHYSIAWIFLLIFFFTFYTTFIAYKLLHKEKFELGDIILLVSNSFIFFGLGYDLLGAHDTGQQLLGLFALCNAIIHFGISLLFYRKKLADSNLFYLVSGLVLLFVTITFPIQLDGNWVTLLWAGEAALLFWIGKTKRVAVYEKIAYPLMLLAFISILQDWSYLLSFLYYDENYITPVLNVNFLSSILFVTAFAFITFLHQSKTYPSALSPQGLILKLISFVIPGILILSLYNAFRNEIDLYWAQLFDASTVVIPNEDYDANYSNYDLLKFKSIWINNYSLFFVAALSYINFTRIKNSSLGIITLGLSLLTILIFLTQSLYEISELRQSYLSQHLVEYYPLRSYNLWIRYVSFVFVALAIYAVHKFTLQDYFRRNMNLMLESLLHISILWILSSELLHWMDIGGSSQTYKLGLSILWGSYSLLLISLGIWKKKAYLRIGAIALFAVTLLKLFLYDISNLNTISKTIVFVSLGVLLLIISFLYNKYKHIISDDPTG